MILKNNTAVILTCHNRKDKTLDCLKSLTAIIPDCEIFLTDDGCTDGTREAIKELFPAVHIIIGDGQLFWNRGMYAAWKEAVKQKFDQYLWLNDDIILYPFFMEELMECYRICGKDSIISGMIEEANSHEVLYGGTNDKGQLIGTSAEPMPISNMNGNVVLVPQTVVDRIGILDPTFIHDLGDVDYGLTAQENGIKVYCTRKPVAAGYRNDFCRIRRWGTTISKRFKRMYTPLGSHPKLNYYFRKKHYGRMNATAFVLFQYIINILPDSMIGMLFGDKYKDK